MLCEDCICLGSCSVSPGLPGCINFEKEDLHEEDFIIHLNFDCSASGVLLMSDGEKRRADEECHKHSCIIVFHKPSLDQQSPGLDCPFQVD